MSLSPLFRCLVGLLLAGAARADAAAVSTTTTTSYHYNADGAPTAATTRVDAAAPTTAYLTWDNFTPDAAAPASGIVRAADGNLLGIGPRPGPPAQFGYDVRDRLTACAADGQPAVSYAYHPASLMKSSTLASGDALQFYYGNGAAPRMVNTVQPSTGAAASFLGPVRYLNDGTEQVLLTPRKDVAGTYDADAQTLAPYAYEPYGASERAGRPRSQGYDLTANSFQYAGEYRDPSCGAYYLRHRWYLALAALQTFLSRDPADGLHRYGYTGGNPIGRTDPTGLRYSGGFSHRVDQVVHQLAPGIGGYFEPLVPLWGQVLGGIQLVGLVPRFWHHQTVEGYVTLGGLALSVVGEGLSAPRALDRLVASPAGALAARVGVDAALGGSQTAAQAYRHGRLDVPALAQGIETTVSGIVWARFAAGLGYRPHALTVGDVDRLYGTLDDDEVLVFRAREKGFTNPLLEMRAAGGAYHEYAMAVSRESILFSEIRSGPVTIEGREYSGPYLSREGAMISAGSELPSARLTGRDGPFALVGTFSEEQMMQIIYPQRGSLPTLDNQASAVARTGTTITVAAGDLNAHAHVTRIVDRLQALAPPLSNVPSERLGLTPIDSNPGDQ